ncbi:type II CRISPR-associated endonuclease Cas1 [Mycoplasma enhydrae]|uniref:type II CRISPR-associated endonuclease Cas1 n=1 Tax=Mycoplasma enhydrae TaxID=2499220 RepID=UPI00197C6404|nr:type II CRISPR-associated endonuclease Cas1 [Mycoplasma enhydrae]MBN4089566.1 type II CRISPR-associated endonuclease Cas1 [Mycoplasma enhydrae]MCV3753585.1 type II CRISPR-associated endonuclease Cas1 [Mycoplasma enhydrae]
MKKVIDVSKSEYLSLFLGNLIVKKEQSKIIIPINDIETIIFENNRMAISIPLINDLIEKKVNIIFCDYKHMPIAQIIPFNGYFDNKVFASQLSWDDKYKAKTWQLIIKLKILNSKNLIENLIPDDISTIENLSNYFEDVKIMDLSNREGHAAKVYFKSIFGKDFIREKENANDYINIYLNYGYSVLMSYVSRSLVSKGFDNRISVFHKSFNNNVPLACDLVEPLRCIVDNLVYKFVLKKNSKIESNFKDYKEELFLYLQQHIVVNNKQMKIIDYIDYLTKGILENRDIKELAIDWSSK